MVIRKEGSKRVLHTKDKKNVPGRHGTRGAAERQERAIQAHKHA